MSKYTDMLADKYRCHCGTCEVQKGNVSEEECKICSHYVIREALQIADILERADKISNKDIHIKACKKYGCGEHECPYRERDMFCPSISMIFFDGYEQALKDIRGDNND